MTTTALDTNVVVAYWGPDPSLNLAVQAALESAFARGNVTVAAPVFAELIAAPGRTENFVSAFFADTGIAVDWDLGEAIWRSLPAGRFEPTQNGAGSIAMPALAVFSPTS